MSDSTPQLLDASSATSAPAATPGKRKKLFGILAAVVILAGGGYGAYWFLSARTTWAHTTPIPALKWLH